MKLAVGLLLAVILTLTAAHARGPLWAFRAASPPPPASNTYNHKGINDDVLWSYSGSSGWGAQSTRISAMQGMGAGWVRVLVGGWMMGDTGCSGGISFTSLDATQSAAATAGLNMLMIIGSPANCMSINPGCNGAGPASGQNQTYVNDYVVPLVQHYAPKGVHWYEIFNEPDLGWVNCGGTVATYVDFMQRAYTAIHANDSAAVVIGMGGAAWQPWGSFINSAYANGGVHGFMDALSIHPYPSCGPSAWGSDSLNCGSNNGASPIKWQTITRNISGNTSLTSLMATNGDGSLPIWITEIGCNDLDSPPDAFACTDTQMANMVTAVFANANAFSQMGPVFWFTNFDQCSNSTPGNQCGFGLFNGTPTIKSSGTALTNANGCTSNGSFSSAPLCITPGYYVATNGSDSNAGTLAAPFATLGKCQSAMQGSSTKTCYLRGGSYTSSNYNGSGCPPYGVNAIYLDTADSGETWSYYPSDGVDTAVLNGNTQFGFCILGNNGVTSNITINGLKFTGWTGGAIELGGVGSHNVTGTTIENNIVTGNSLNGTQYSGFNVIGAVPNTTVANNYCYNLVNMCVGANDLNNGSTYFLGGLNNLTIKNNIAINVCSGNTDCGAYYIEDLGDGSANNFSTSIQIINNYCNNVSNNGAEGNQCIYFDNAASNTTVEGNVLGPGMGNSCLQMHGSMNITVKYNICDMKTGSYVFYQPNCAAVNGPNIGLSTSMANNFWQTNIMVGNSSGTAGGNGYWNVNGGNNPSNTYTYCNSPYGNPSGGTSSPPNNLTVSGNEYHNYGSGGITTGGTGGAGGDSSPINANPGITCWKANISSPPSGWVALPQSWGPLGAINPASLPGSPTTVTPSWGPSC